MKGLSRLTACEFVAAAAFAVSLLALPVMAHAQPAGGTNVSFNSKDASAAAFVVGGHLWVPAGATKGAVVLVHGSSGWTDHREGHYGRALSAAGYAALAIDSFGARGVKGTAEDQTLVTSTDMIRDAFAARRFLIERGFPADRIAVMGFSKGGMVALYAAHRNYVPEETERFAASLPFYPGCHVRLRVPKPASTMFMVLGDKDDYTGVTPCQQVADDYRKAGGNVTVKIYPGATHGFDGNPKHTGRIDLRWVENYMDCEMFLEDDGSFSYQGQRYATANDAELVKQLRKTCVRKGASVWTNLRQKEAATRDAIAFLDQLFAR